MYSIKIYYTMKSFWFVLWIVLGLFSLVGLGGWSEIFPSLDIWDDDIFMILVLFPLNFILCHFISYHIWILREKKILNFSFFFLNSFISDGPLLGTELENERNF